MPTLQDVEERRLSRQRALDELKNAEERNRWGQFATPPQLATQIAKDAWTRWRKRAEPVKFLDPAIGTGSFYSAFLATFPHHRIQPAAGIELDPNFVNAARTLWSETDLTVTQADFTELSPPPEDNRFNLILTNPPYVRHHHLSQSQKPLLQQKVAERLNIKISGLAGLYCYFLLLSHDWLAQRGIAYWLIPSEFMTVNYGAALRRYLSTHVTLLQIHRFSPDDVQFADALVTSAIVVFQKSAPPNNHHALFTFGDGLSKPHNKQRIPIAELKSSERWANFSENGAPHTETASTIHSLGQLFTAKRGLATGANNFFIIPRDQAEELGIPSQYTKPILPSPRHLQVSVIESLPDRYPDIPVPLSLIDCNLPEETIREEAPHFAAYLQSGKERHIHEGYLASRRTPWYSQERRPPAPFLCTYMGRTKRHDARPFRILWNKSQATAANVYLMLYPKRFLQHALDQDATLYKSLFEIFQTLKAEYYLKESRVYGGGLHKLEPKELARLSAKPFLSLLKPFLPPPQRSLFD